MAIFLEAFPHLFVSTTFLQKSETLVGSWKKQHCVYTNMRLKSFLFGKFYVKLNWY